MVNSLDQLIPRRFRSIGTGPEEQFIETRHAHVCDTAADLTVRREDGSWENSMQAFGLITAKP